MAKRMPKLTPKQLRSKSVATAMPKRLTPRKRKRK